MVPLRREHIAQLLGQIKIIPLQDRIHVDESLMILAYFYHILILKLLIMSWTNCIIRECISIKKIHKFSTEVVKE